MVLQRDDEILLHDLQQYLRINTAHPQPAYGQAMTFLQSLAERDGFAYKTVILPSGLPVLIISYFGIDHSLPALALNHHTDVVPVLDAEQWDEPAFLGAITEDGRIIGRGTQDMKGIGMVHYHALRALKQAGVLPERSIHILCVPDEEKGGFNGVKQLVEQEVFRQLKIGYVLDEGRPSGIDNLLYVKIDERKPLQVLVCAQGQAAHGSKLTAENANHNLIEFLQQIVHMHKEQQAQAVNTQPGLLLSMHITSLSAGFNDDAEVMNVVPAVAYAAIDIRIPPAAKMHTIITMLDCLCAKFSKVSYRIIAAAEERSESFDCSMLYDRLSKSIENNGYTVKPLFSEGASDMRHYHKAGIQGVGFTPFTSVDNLHGTNESITLNELIEGKKLMTDFLKTFCGKE